MLSSKRVGFIFLCSFLLVSCVKRTTRLTQTFYDNVFSFVAAGNIYLKEWDSKPDDYVDYMPHFKKYQYTFRHDGTVLYEAIYRRLDSEEWVNVLTEGTYFSRLVGPNQSIEITLSDHLSKLVWEPNPREPWGSLVFRLCDERDEKLIGEKVFVTLYSKSISPYPI